MDETPVHADLEPPPELPGAARPSEQPLAAIGTAVDTSKGPKWVQNDKKVGQQANPKAPHTPLWACNTNSTLLFEEADYLYQLESPL